MNEPIENMMQRYRDAVAAEAQTRLIEASDLIANFTAFAEKKGVTLSSGSFSYIPTIGIIASAPCLATRIIGPIPTERDGLIAMTHLTASHTLKSHLPGYFADGNYMLMAHPYFRRGLYEQANFAPRFIELFWAFNINYVAKYIAIDENRLRVNVDSSAYFEEDTWYGAPFREDIEKIPNGIVKLRPPMDLQASYNDFLFAKAYCLDVKWSQQDNIKTFQALELKTQDVQIIISGERYHPARYLHAEFDLTKGNFRHFDGAIQLYTENEYLHRRDSDFNVNIKHFSQIKAHSKKLFKFNGPLSIATWAEFCCHFFTGNPLVFEYFTGSYPEHIVDILIKLRARGALNAEHLGS